MSVITETHNQTSKPTKSRSNTKSMESNLGAVPKIDISGKREKFSMKLRKMWNKIRDYFVKADKTKSVPIIIDDAYNYEFVEEIKDNCFLIQLQREFKLVPKRERRQMKLHFIQFIQQVQPTIYHADEDEGCFINIMNCIKQEVMLF